MDVLAVDAAAARRPPRGENDRRALIFSSAAPYRFRAHSMYDPELYRTKPKWRSGRSAIRFRP